MISELSQALDHVRLAGEAEFSRSQFVSGVKLRLRSPTRFGRSRCGGFRHKVVAADDS